MDGKFGGLGLRKNLVITTITHLGLKLKISALYLPDFFNLGVNSGVCLVEQHCGSWMSASGVRTIADNISSI